MRRARGRRLAALRRVHFGVQTCGAHARDARPGVHMESDLHLRLKRLGARFLIERGFQAVALEVSSPIPRHRVDVAGHLHGWAEAEEEFTWAPTLFGPESARRNGTARRAGTVLIECKQSRADFLRDTRHLATLLSRRAELHRHREALEDRLIRVSEPHLIASGSMLFPEMETWDFASSRSPGYRSVLRELRRIDAQIHGDTKFWTVARYALADVLLIAAPRGMIRAAELPAGWGLLEFTPEWLDVPDHAATPAEQAPPSAGYAAPLEFRVRPAATPRPAQLTREVHRVRLLRNIAVATTAAAGVHRPFLHAVASARGREPMLYPPRADARVAATITARHTADAPRAGAPRRDRAGDSAASGGHPLRPDRVG